MKKILTLITIIITTLTFAQNVGINSTGAAPDASAMLDVNAFPGNDKGILIPRVALLATNNPLPITAPVNSLIVYNTASAGTSPNNVIPGFYYWNGTKWIAFGGTGGTDWSLTGNAGTSAGTNFVGTTDAVDFAMFTNNTEKLRVTSAGNVGIGTAVPNSSALVDMTTFTQGFAMPRLTTVQRLAIASPIDGLQVYDTNLKGFYYFNGTNWNCVTTPAGTVDYFANTTAPVGYLECNGQSVNAAQYPELFTAIGYTYGGSGATFKVPDLRGEFIRGADHGRGVDPGRVFGTSQSGTLVVGDFDTDPSAGCLSSTAGSYQSLYGADPFDATVYSPTTTRASYATSSIVSAAEDVLPGYFGASRPRNIALMPCIKY